MRKMAGVATTMAAAMIFFLFSTVALATPGDRVVFLDEKGNRGDLIELTEANVNIPKWAKRFRLETSGESVEYALPLMETHLFPAPPDPWMILQEGEVLVVKRERVKLILRATTGTRNGSG